MDLIPYLAAHAPTEIPEWFEHEEPTGRPVRPDWAQHPLITCEDDNQRVREWLSDGWYDLPEHLQPIAEEKESYHKAENTWQDDNRRARYFQWRKFYAEQMALTLSAG
jgi:hypothetical protein